MRKKITVLKITPQQTIKEYYQYVNMSIYSEDYSVVGKKCFVYNESKKKEALESLKTEALKGVYSRLRKLDKKREKIVLEKNKIKELNVQ